MRLLLITLLICVFGCKQPQHHISNPTTNAVPEISYDELKKAIIAKRKYYGARFASFPVLAKKENIDTLTDYWVNTISNDLYSKWQNTAWDFNGTTTEPQHGAIACGYFVTTLLQAMDLKIERQRLAVCPSSEMMKALVPKQAIKNLSYESYPDFCNSLDHSGKAVYIIGLDFHTGFIVNDGKESWFIHSYYVRRKGVVKEKIGESVALRSSKTRWLISLTNDRDFLYRWIHAK